MSADDVPVENLDNSLYTYHNSSVLRVFQKLWSQVSWPAHNIKWVSNEQGRNSKNLPIAKSSKCFKMYKIACFKQERVHSKSLGSVGRWLLLFVQCWRFVCLQGLLQGKLDHLYTMCATECSPLFQSYMVRNFCIVNAPACFMLVAMLWRNLPDVGG